MNEEQAFKEVMDIQSNYKFLGHDEMTSKEKKREVMEKINKRIQSMQAKLYYFGFILIMALGLGLTSCNRTPIEQPSKPEMVTQSFGLTNVQELGMKSFDPNAWVYQYNSQQFELKISNEYNTYTRLVSIPELLQGNVILTMVKGVYDVSYTPVHPNKYSPYLDVRIEETGVQIMGTPINLEGQYDASLVIIDVPTVSEVSTGSFDCTRESGLQTNFFNYDQRGFFYAYTSEPINNLQLWDTGLNKAIGLTINPLYTGKIYWVVSSLGVTIHLDIPDMEIEQVPL
jgi:hypothetical protein